MQFFTRPCVSKAMSTIGFVINEFAKKTFSHSLCQQGRFSHKQVIWIRHVLSSCRMLSKFLVRFSKWLQSVKKGVIDLFLCIAMAYNVFPCTEIIRNTQTEKIADFTM